MHKKKKLKLWLTGLCLLLILAGGYLLVLRGLMPNVMIQGEAMVSNQARAL